LRDELEDLAEPRRADRMPFRFETSRRVHRDAAADPRIAPRRRRATFAERTESEVLDLHDLAHGGRVVDLGNAHLARPDSGLFVSRERGATADVAFDLFRTPIGARTQDRGANLDRAAAIETPKRTLRDDDRRPPRRR